MSKNDICFRLGGRSVFGHRQSPTGTRKEFSVNDEERKK